MFVEVNDIIEVFFPANITKYYKTAFLVRSNENNNTGAGPLTSSRPFVPSVRLYSADTDKIRLPQTVRMLCRFSSVYPLPTPISLLLKGYIIITNEIQKIRVTCKCASVLRSRLLIIFVRTIKEFIINLIIIRRLIEYKFDIIFIIIYGNEIWPF